MTIYKMYPRQQFNACNVLLNVFPYLCILCTIWPKNCLISQSDGVIRIDKPIFIAHTTYSILRSRTCSSDWVRAKVAGVQKGDGKNDKSISALSLHDLDQELLPLPNEIIWRWKVSHVYLAPKASEASMGVLLAPKVHLEFLWHMITIQSHPIQPTKPL